MLTCNHVDDLKQEINDYERHFTGMPLLVGFANNWEYAQLLPYLRDDPEKQLIAMSAYCMNDFPPDPKLYLEDISKQATQKSIIWLGTTHCTMFQGQQATKDFLQDLLCSSFYGSVTVLCPFCNKILTDLAQSNRKYDRNIILLDGDIQQLPTLYFDTATTTHQGSVKTIPQLLVALEQGDVQPEMHIVSKRCKRAYFPNSMYLLAESAPYQHLCKLDRGIAERTQEANGTPQEWQQLEQELGTSKSLAQLCSERLVGVRQLNENCVEFLSSKPFDRFLCFISLKVFYNKQNTYLACVLKEAKDVTSFIDSLYMKILDIAYRDTNFANFMQQRRKMLQKLGYNRIIIQKYCQQAVMHKDKNILWYLSDDSEEERKELIHALCCYSYSSEELATILPHVSQQLTDYLQPFTFNQENTKVLGFDSNLHQKFTDYFQRYKLQKLSNTIEDDFLTIVEQEATARNFLKVRHRSAIVQQLTKTDLKPYFFDALGVEFLAFIKAKAEEYGLHFQCEIGHCNLPSITCKNKEFYNAFPADSILKEDGLDDLKHHGIKYNYQKTPEPLHIFEELHILDTDLKQMSDELNHGQIKRIVILSDHGASRLAVIHKSENKMLQLPNAGQHSGRCCPVDEDPHIPFATVEDGYAVLANYERFKGSRKADVETHGGASLEEVLVPVIELSLQQKKESVQTICFVTKGEKEVICSPKDGTQLHLFADPPLQKPRLVVNNNTYEGIPQNDNRNVIFNLPDIRRKGKYQADVYDGDSKLQTLEFTTKRQTVTNDLF